MNRLAFGFHHLLGPVYGCKEGASLGAELAFTPHAGVDGSVDGSVDGEGGGGGGGGGGHELLVPVGNRVNVVDLRHNRTRTLALENRGNIHHLALSPDGRVLVTVDERGGCLLAAMPKGVEVGRFAFKEPATALCFSPDSKWLLVGQGRRVEVWHTPRVDRKQFAPFRKYRTFLGAFDDVLCLDWSQDSRHVLVGSRDMTVRVYALRALPGFRRGTLGGHRDWIVAAAFAHPLKTLLYTVSRDGRLCSWQWTHDAALMQRLQQEQDKQGDDEEEDDADGPASDEDKDDEGEAEEVEEENFETTLQYGHWALTSKHYFHSGASERSHLSSATFHCAKNLLVVGFSDGVFSLYSTTTFECVHSLSIGNSTIHSIAISPSGEWLAFGAAAAGQLLVWEWQSETYVIKQQAHVAGGMRRICYSPDGRLLATAGQDGKLKLWDTATGACFVTFGDHQGPVTDLAFNAKGNAVFSCSMDGTLRGFDLTRYRNFRTMASPEPVQFSCMAMDPSGEIACAGTLDDFTVYVFSVQTGALLDVLGGHQAPVSCVLFSPSDPVLASCSWDGTVRLHQLYGRGRGSGAKEVLRHGETGRDVTCAAYRPDGQELVVGLLDGTLHFWDPHEASELGIIDGRPDMWAGRAATDLRRAGRQSGHFAAVAYAAGGEAVLCCADGSRYVLMYGCLSRTLLKRFALSENVTVDGVLEVQNSRLLTDFGPMAEVAPDQDAFVARQLALPGATAPVARDVRVSPSGDEWCALSPEGVHVYRRDPDLVLDAPGLGIAQTPEAVALALRKGEPTRALAMSLGLEASVTPLVLRCIAVEHVALVASALPVPFVPRLLAVLAELINSDSKDLQLCLLWTRHLLGAHGRVMAAEYARFREPVLALHRALNRKFQSVAAVCNRNLAMMRFLVEAPVPLEDVDAATEASMAGAEVEENEGADAVEDLQDAVDDVAELEGWGEQWAGAEAQTKRQRKKEKKKKSKQ